MPICETSPFSAAMRRACEEARLWMGAPSPNPAVGAAALDGNGTILAIAAHHRAGEDHAEAALLKMCRAQNILGRVETLCVTLEPCNHHGRTPPCTEAIIEAKIPRVVVGIRDPNPDVSGGGCNRLRAAGIEVIEGIESEMCRRSMHAFLFYAQSKRPFLTLKRAFNPQGSMIPAAGQKTFTSQTSLTLAHRLRKKADALITGSGTVLADDPQFTVRYVPDYPGKRRILAILDRRGRVPASYIAQAATRGLDVGVYQTLDSCLNDLVKHESRDILVESGPILSQTVLDSFDWTMVVDIHQDETDRVNVRFNPSAQIPFETNELELTSLLPLE